MSGAAPADGLPVAPAAERNKGAILDVLRPSLPAAGTVLEIASGTGQHVLHFARALPHLCFQPSEPDADSRAIVAARVARAGLPNLAAPLDLDVAREPWPIGAADAIVCINMIHISPWTATLALFAGARRVLPAGAVLCLYGPFRRHGEHTAPSNAAFDADLRRRDPSWGVRDLETVTEVAAEAGLTLERVEPMPANNLTVLFRRH